MARMTLDFPGLDKMCRQLEELSSTDTLRKVTEGALKECFVQTQKDVNAAISKSPYNFARTGETASAVKTSDDVQWSGGTAASIGVGFDISGKETGHSGLASLFLMHGTKVGGTPRIAPDRKLYNAVFGAAARKKRKAICEKALSEAIDKLKEG